MGCKSLLFINLNNHSVNALKQLKPSISALLIYKHTRAKHSYVSKLIKHKFRALTITENVQDNCLQEKHLSHYGYGLC